MTVGKYSKTGNKGATTMFVGYNGRENDGIQMWDPRTARAVVMLDIIWIWLKCMHFGLSIQQEYWSLRTCLLSLNMEETPTDDVMSVKTNTPLNWEAVSHGMILL